MKEKVLSCYSSILSACGITFSIQDLSQVLNVILIILSIINILIVLFFNLKNKVIKALEDNKITQEEAEDILKTIEDSIKDIDKEIK